MGRRHLHAYRALRAVGAEGFELAAVCDQRLGAAEEAAGLAEEILGARPAVYSDHEELISSGAVQALDLVADPSAHHTIAVPALEAGLHVICEKPLGITVRAARAIVDAAARSGAVLATAENYRRDAPNRLARAVIEAGMLGDLHLMMQTDVGGDHNVVISPWRHIREAGSLALDMGVHYADIFSYFLGELESVSGEAFVAEPLRVLAPGTASIAEIEEVSPGVIRATGEDSLVALFESASGVLVQLAFVPSGPGHHWLQRSVHGRAGSMSVPPDRSGGAVIVRLGDRTLSGGELRRELGGFELEGVSAAFFGPNGNGVRPAVRRGRRGTDRDRAGRLHPRDRRRAAARGRRHRRPARGRCRLGGRRVPRTRRIGAHRRRRRRHNLRRARSHRRGHRTSTEREAELDMTEQRIVGVACPRVQADCADRPRSRQGGAALDRRAGHRSVDGVPARSDASQGDALLEKDVAFSFRHAFAWQGERPVRADPAPRWAEHLRRPPRPARRRAASPRQVRRRPSGGRAPKLSPAASRRCRARADTAPKVTARSRTSSRPESRLIVELIDAPRVRIEPEFVYPPSGG